MKVFGKEKKVTNTQQKATPSWKKKADRGKENFPRAATKLEVPFWGLSAPKLPDSQALDTNMGACTGTNYSCG